MPSNYLLNLSGISLKEEHAAQLAPMVDTLLQLKVLAFYMKYRLCLLIRQLLAAGEQAGEYDLHRGLEGREAHGTDSLLQVA